MEAADLSRLSAPFPLEEIDWRIQRSGVKNGEPWAIVVPYVDARAIMRRLDEVACPEHWETKMLATPKGIFCELSLRIDGEWVTKTDGSEETEWESFKGGISKALVRAAVQWGIGRDLYQLPTIFAEFVERGTTGARYAKIDGDEFWWVPQAQALEQRHPTWQPGECVVPFGHNRGKKLSELNPEELAGLAAFYSRVPDPRGRARTFKGQFEAFHAAQKQAS